VDRLEREGAVLVDVARRKAVVRAQAEEAVRQLGGAVEIDEELLTEVTHLVEFPTAFAGSFDREFLKVPAEILVTTMKEHQRYFPVRGADGALLPYFVGVRNGDARHIDIVRAGNERVLSARLADARFFFEED